MIEAASKFILQTAPLQANLLLGPVVYPSTVVTKSIGVVKRNMFIPNLVYMILADTGLHKLLERICLDLLMEGGGGGENGEISNQSHCFAAEA